MRRVLYFNEGKGGGYWHSIWKGCVRRMISVRGIPTREINGLPYSVHQIQRDDQGQEQYQIVIQNCVRHPAGYTFAPVYTSYRDAITALQQWRSGAELTSFVFAGDDTGSVYETQLDD